MGCTNCRQKNDQPKSLQSQPQIQPALQKPIEKPRRELQKGESDKKGTHLDGEPTDVGQRIDTPEKEGQVEIKQNISRSVKRPEPPAILEFDVSPKVVKKNTIYKISDKLPVHAPYSKHSEWQKIIERHLTLAEDVMAGQLLQLRNRNWVTEQYNNNRGIAQSKNAVSLNTLVSQRNIVQVKEHFNWLAWALSVAYATGSLIKKVGLPKLNSKSWNEGFEWKGVYVKVIPYEDAFFVLNELTGLKYCQTELLELAQLAPELPQIPGQSDKLHEDIILPLLAAVRIYGFLLVASPVIYTQEMDYREEHKVLPKSYSYLHRNIRPDIVDDSFLKYMPCLKRINNNNLVPVIDFEEYNSNKASDLDLKYILCNVYDTIPRLSDHSASSILMRIPAFINEDMTYHRFPQTQKMEIKDLNKFIQGVEDVIENGDEVAQNQRKFFSKHGWDMIIISRSNATNENTRASSLFNSKENQQKYLTMEEIMADPKLQAEMHLNYGSNHPGTNQSIDIQNSIEAGEQQSRYYSPHKDTILRKENEQEEIILGTVLVSAFNYKKDFKFKYSINNHQISTNVESLFSASMDQVVKILECSDTIYNIASLKHLMHRKGLNIRFLWCILTKLKLQPVREIVQIAILLRVMRRIVNEECKVKARVLHQGKEELEQFYIGNNQDVFKETLLFCINAILKRKFLKHKLVTEEALLGLFLSRMSIMGIVFDLNLKKEELIYLESKDILEDVLKAPSCNPAFFINSVQDYFGLNFKQEFLRTCRTDKFLFLSKDEPVTSNDITSVKLIPHFYFTIKEQAFFLLAQQMSNSQEAKKHQKVKTKTDKDKLIKTSFSRQPNALEESPPAPNSVAKSPSQAIGPHSSRRARQKEDSHQIPRESNFNSISNFDKEDSMTARGLRMNEKTQIQATVRQYQNIDKNMEVKQSSVIDLSAKVGQRKSTFKPQKQQEFLLPAVLYKLKTQLQSQPVSIFDEGAQGNNKYLQEDLSHTVLRPYYDLPSIDDLNGWIIVLESLLQNVHSVDGSEQVLLEALTFHALFTIFYEAEPENEKIFGRIGFILQNSIKCSPEILMMINVIGALGMESTPTVPKVESEKQYLQALMFLFKQYGDPRGRGNTSIPYCLLLSWKLSVLPMIQDKKTHDSEYAEELFDATLFSLFNHKKNFRDHQTHLQLLSSNIGPSQRRERLRNMDPSSFEKKIEQDEISRLQFDLKAYRKRKRPVQRRGSQSKHGRAAQEMVMPKSKSVFIGKKRNEGVDLSDIDLEDIDDEVVQLFIEENFRSTEWLMVTMPFQHWQLYRSIVPQSVRGSTRVGLQRGNTELDDTTWRDILKSPPKDLLFQWLMKYNPLFYQSGQMFSHKEIQETFENSSNQIISSSGSSIMSSNPNMSSKSFQGGLQQKETRRTYLGSYSQMLTKEVGGINRNELGGSLYVWGQNSSGQLGSEFLLDGLIETGLPPLKLLLPRILINLKEEIVKEVSCGFGHSVCITLNQSVYVWGHNENGQLGLGDEAPEVIKKPVLNTELKNISKISCGIEHTVALSKSGQLFSWGIGGVLGHGDDKKRTKPTKVEFFKDTKVTIAVCGGIHTLAYTSDGDLYTWGATEGAQLGQPQEFYMSKEGAVENITRPIKVAFFNSKVQISQIAAGETHNIVLTKQGQVYGWGSSNFGQLGTGISGDSFDPGEGMEKSKVYVPVLIKALEKLSITKIFCGSTFSLFLNSMGEVFACGANDLGQLGLDGQIEEVQELQKMKKNVKSDDVVVPTKLYCLEGQNISSLAAGENHVLGVTGQERNMLWSWGFWKNGQLGQGDVSGKMNPRPIQNLCTLPIHRIACGSKHSCAIVGDVQAIAHAHAHFGQEDIPNPFHLDITPLNQRASLTHPQLDDDQVPDDESEGMAKNPL